MTNILIIGNNSAGVYNFRGDLIKELLKDHQVSVSTPDNGQASQIEKLGCKVIVTEVDRRGINPVKDFALLLRYRKICMDENPSMVVTYTIKPNIYGGMVCRMLGIPYAANITGLGTTFQHEGVLKTLVTVLYRNALKKAKVVFFENEENRQVFISERIVPERITHTLHGAGVNTDKFAYIPYPENHDGFKFLFMGRVMKEKGVDELFTAVKRLVADGVNCKLYVLGHYEEDYSEVIKTGTEEGWLVFPGFQADVRPFIGDCDCFILPSWHEGMANTNLECASCGRPVITTRIHGCMEAVEENVTGFLVEKQDADSLYNAIKRFVSLTAEERRLMGIAGRQRMLDIFDKKKVVEETIHFLFQ